MKYFIPKNLGKVRVAMSLGGRFTVWNGKQGPGEFVILCRDRKQAEELGLEGTPMIYINGRYFSLDHFDLRQDLQPWIDLEIALNSSGHPAAATGTGGSAGKSSTAPVATGAGVAGNVPAPKSAAGAAHGGAKSSGEVKSN